MSDSSRTAAYGADNPYLHAFLLHSAIILRRRHVGFVRMVIVNNETAKEKYFVDVSRDLSPLLLRQLKLSLPNL